MGHAQRLSAGEVLDVMRLLGEVRELSADPTRWRQRALEGLAKLTGATVGLSVEAYGLERPAVPVIAIIVDRGWRGEAERRLYSAHIEDRAMGTDPFYASASRLLDRPAARFRRQLVDDAAWYGSPMVNHTRLPAGVDDLIFSTVPLPPIPAGRGGPPLAGVDHLALHRPPDAPPFAERQRRVLRLFHHELNRVWRTHPATGGTPAARLTPRQRQVVDLLAAGRSEKQAAAALGVTPTTLHGYVKAVHARLGVGSRGELLAACRPPAFVPRLIRPGTGG